MVRKYVLPLLAVLGLIFAVRTVRAGQTRPEGAPPVVEPSRAPFEHSVAGSGIIEASSENISIASELSGVVKEIQVQLGSKVKKGDPLFRLEDRNLHALLGVRKAAVSVAQAELQNVEAQFALWEKISDRRAVSEEDWVKKKFAVSIARASAERAAAEAHATEVDIERSTVRAPIDGTVLQLKLRVGEYVPASQTSPPILLLGNTDVLHVRVDVDENDAWRVNPSARAKAFLRGNTKYSTDLEFVRFEPYVLPKRSLTGDSTERVDTRVLQVIYRYKPETLRAYVGQLLDVFIDATEGAKAS